MRISAWERDRQLRADLSAIEAVKGIGDEWYRARERLYRFRDSHSFRDIPRLAGMHPETSEKRLESEDVGEFGGELPAGSISDDSAS